MLDKFKDYYFIDILININMREVDFEFKFCDPNILWISFVLYNGNYANLDVTCNICLVR